MSSLTTSFVNFLHKHGDLYFYASIQTYNHYPHISRLHENHFASKTFSSENAFDEEWDINLFTPQELISYDYEHEQHYLKFYHTDKWTNKEYLKVLIVNYGTSFAYEEAIRLSLIPEAQQIGLLAEETNADVAPCRDYDYLDINNIKDMIEVSSDHFPEDVRNNKFIHWLKM
jgi:hypothetical protein